MNTNKQKTQTVNLTIELINDQILIIPDDEDPTTLPDDVGVDPIPTDTDPDTTTTTPDDIVSIDEEKQHVKNAIEQLEKAKRILEAKS